MESKKEFMLLFRMEPSNEQPTAEQLQEMETQWGGYFGSIAQQGSLVSTHHLGFNGCVIAPGQHAGEGFYIAEGHMVAGNLVVNVDSMDAAIEIALMLSNGLAAKEIANALGTSVNTINNQKNALLEKFDCLNSTELIIKLAQMGYVTVL